MFTFFAGIVITTITNIVIVSVIRLVCNPVSALRATNSVIVTLSVCYMFAMLRILSRCRFLYFLFMFPRCSWLGRTVWSRRSSRHAGGQGRERVRRAYWAGRDPGTTWKQRTTRWVEVGKRAIGKHCGDIAENVQLCE